ncbi:MULTISPECIES: PepSY domain-containing protein [unclassified Rhodanobacter]|uniref:PepSY domain-containing protein n=1 Tax=Rhodanobacter humi TaxID=1888173 RepID=A0ABV4AN52_9GAMM
MRKSIVLGLPFALCGLVFAAQAETPAQLAAQAKISMTQARKIALQAVPGQVVKQELEKEAGGSGLRYSFDIKSGKDTREVGVDAKTGKLLENSLDNNDAD